MRHLVFGVAAISLLTLAGQVQAKSLNSKEVEMCRWGADVARVAQQSKLSGTTLYSARQKLKIKKFSKPWMPKMALGITEQTYVSKSRLQPSSVKKAYYDGCVQHELSLHRAGK